MSADRSTVDPAVRVRDLTKSFRRSRREGDTPVLCGLDLDVAAGTLVAVLGPSGCGKTTLLRVVAGFERADGGTVDIAGTTVEGPRTHLAPERRRVGVVPQEQALFPHLSVAANVAYGLGAESRRDGRRVAEMLDLAGLPGLGARMPHELSGGQQQRVALARALAPAPSVVLLDEPFGGLDAALRLSIRSQVRDMLQATGATAVLVTHDQEEALSVADRVAVMRDGRVVQEGTPADVYSAPVDLGVATFVGEANVLAGTAKAGLVTTALGRLPLSERAGRSCVGPVAVVVRPEQVHVVASARGGAVVEDRLYFGHDAMLRLRLDDGSLVLSRVTRSTAVAPGERAKVTCEGPVACYDEQVALTAR
ncbi:MAG TPA: ABC transporter ATP-binding protein [Mycobacteriales bacterium]|nr:ABC transporter ATP-binding protein [Mycobacteriales bacterium]